MKMRQNRPEQDDNLETFLYLKRIYSTEMPKFAAQ